MKLPSCAAKNERFKARLAILAFGDANELDVAQTKLVHYFFGDRELPFTAVDQNQIRPGTGFRFTFRLLGNFLVAPKEYIAHRSVVVARCNRRDVIEPILRRLHRSVIKHHTRGDGRFAHGVRNIETLHALQALHFQRLLH